MSAIRVPLSEPRYSTESVNAQPQIVFTRQLWERTMPTTETDDTSTSSQGNSSISRDQGASRSRRPSSVVPLPPHPQPSPTRSRISDTPLTPEESPPFHSSRKRSVDVLDHDDYPENSPSHTGDNSSDSTPTFCLCQPEPKVPRPRNAFILYRQNHQAAVVAQNPGLANPDISKIIGEQWRNETDEEKNKWKAYAEEEKLQHQQRYPSYRYQPKRAGRRASIRSDTGVFPFEHRRCPKCGGRSIAQPTPGTPSSRHQNINSTETSPSIEYSQLPRVNTFTLPPPTPSSTTTPSTRYLPMLNNLSLNSPHARRMAQGRSLQQFGPSQRGDDRRPSPLTPDSKRRRFESPQGTYVMSTRTMPPRQSADPGTPFPFLPQQQQQSQSASQQHQQMNVGQQYPNSSMHPHVRRESLPPAADILRGRPNNSGVPPSMMGPPPRPGPGYSQHRVSQGHVRPSGGELSLTLPPLKSVSIPRGTSTGRLSQSTSIPEGVHEPDKRSLGERIMSIPFQHKIGILRRIMPPLSQASKHKGRASVIAIEGDDADAARSLTDWLEECLGREGDMTVKVVDGPRPPDMAQGTELEAPDLLKTVIEWHAKNKEIIELVKQDSSSRKDSANIFSAKESSERSENGEHTTSTEETDSSMMDVDDKDGNEQSSSSRMVVLFRTYTLTASNIYASGIPINDVYRPDDHWQWTATLWRGIAGPDLTIYIKDVEGTNTASSNEGVKGGVEMVEEPKMNYKFMAIRRTRGSGEGRSEKSGCEGVEAGTLRRLGFEVGEWVRSASFSRAEGSS